MIERPGETDAPGRLADLAALVIARCDEVASFSQESGKITRTFLSEPMRALHGRLRRVDGRGRAGCSARSRGELDRPLSGHWAGVPVLVIGSHLDTVPDAGKYDGRSRRLARPGGRAGPRRPTLALRHRRDRVQRRRRRSLPRPVSGQPGGLRADSIADCSIGPMPMESPWRTRFARSGSIRRGSSEAAYPPGALLRLRRAAHRARPGSRSARAPAAVVEAIAGQSRIWAELRGQAGSRGDPAHGGPARRAGGGGRAGARGRAAGSIDRRLAGDGRRAGRRARRVERGSGDGAAQHRRPPRQRLRRGRRRWPS